MKKEVIDILHELESDNGRLFKIKVLEENADNKLLESVIKATLDPYTNYYIRKIPEYNMKEEVKPLDWALDSLKVLSSREKTGNEAIGHLKNILGRTSEGDAEVIKRIIGKDLKCGVSTSTANKVYGKRFIDKYPCMLASTMSKKNLKNINFPCVAQTKMDGMRANIIITEEGDVDVRTRNGKHMELYGHFDETMKGIFYSPASLENLNPFRGAVLDGELLVLDEDKATLLDRKTGNGILNKAVKGTISKEEADRVVMVVWDMIPVNDFREGHSDIAYHDRMGVLSERMEEVENTFEFPLIRLVQIFRVNDYDDAKLLFDMLITGGQEGLILKNEDMPWEDKRSKYQVKMKVELSAELLVTEWNEGTGRIEGLMGSVTCVDANGNLEVNVGSGFNDEDRTMVAEDIVGKIITVKYNEVIQAKEKDKKSLFLPIFEEIRLDKDVADKF